MNGTSVTSLHIDPRETLEMLEAAFGQKIMETIDEIDLEDLRRAVSECVTGIAMIEGRHSEMDIVALAIPHYPGEGVVGAAMYASTMRPAGYRMMAAGIVGPRGEVATSLPASHRQVGFARDGSPDWPKWSAKGGLEMSVGSCEEQTISAGIEGVRPLPRTQIEGIVRRSLEHLAIWGLRSIAKGPGAKAAAKFALAAAAPLAERVAAAEGALATRHAELMHRDDMAAFAAGRPNARLGLWNALRAEAAPDANPDHMKYRQQFLDASPAFEGALGRTYAPCPITRELNAAIDAGNSPMAVYATHVPGLRKAVWKNVLKMDLAGIEPIVDCTTIASVLGAANSAPSNLPVKSRADLDSVFAMKTGLAALMSHAQRLGISYEDMATSGFARGWADGARALVAASAPAALDHATPELIYGFADVALRGIDEMSQWAMEWHAEALIANLPMDCSAEDFARALFATTGIVGLAGRLHAWEAVKGASTLPMTDEEKSILNLPPGAEWTPLTGGETEIDGFLFTELTTRPRMVLESDVMNHCLGSWYADRALKQGHRPFCVTFGAQSYEKAGSPETRATANFMVTESGEISLEQVKAHRNGRVSVELAGAVNSFLAGMRAGTVQANLQCYASDRTRLRLLGELGTAHQQRVHKAEITNRSFAPLLPPEARAAGMSASQYAASEMFASALTEARGMVSAEQLATAAKAEGPSVMSFGA